MVKSSKDNTNTFTVPNEPIVPTVQQPQQQQITVEQAMHAAEVQQQQGNLQEAERITREILSVAPQFAPAIHMMGILAHSVGKTEMGIDFIEQAIAIDNKVPLFHANIAEMCRRLERLDEAVKHGQNAVKLDPKFLFAQSNLGIAYYDLKEYDKAEKHQKIALKIDINFGPSLNNMGSIMRGRDNDYEKAAEYFRKAIEVDPNYIDPQNNLGEALTRLDDPEAGLKILEDVLRKDPKNESAWCNRGVALLAMGDGEESKNSYIRALNIDDTNIAAYAGLIMVALEFNRYELGEECAEKLMKNAPEEADSYSLWGSVKLAQGYSEEAEKLFNQALEIDPDLVTAKTGLGNIALERGDLTGAEEIFRECMEGSEVDVPAGLYSLIQAKKMKPGMPEIEMMEEEAKKLDGKLIDSKAISINFALGKMYDDLKDYEKGFPYYIEGCRIKRKIFEYSSEVKQQQVDRIKEVFTKKYLKDNAGSGNDSKTPIFVLGMPRSGTTLTEQIIASHPSVYGAGELKDMINIVKDLSPDEEGESFADHFEGAKPELFSEIGDNYLKGLVERSPETPHITDKMPGNFHYIGLIRLALPNAKIVHVNRHPLDNCISCFTRLFAHGQGYSYNLEEVGAYYRTYHGLMDHWRSVLDEGDMYDLVYEQLVDDTEEQARKLIEYCGLEWDENCLEFYKHKRSIRTASVTQVRQPIYKTSKQRWKNYDKFIGPIKDALGDVLDHYPT